MSLDERIKNINGYFKSYNIAEGVVYALANFPPKWTVPTEIAELSVKTAKDENGTYFFSEIENGYDKVFDAIEYVITLNKAIEEKSSLLVEKANELKDLFATEPIEVLKTLKFVVVRKKGTKVRKKGEKAVSGAKKAKNKPSKNTEEKKVEEIKYEEPLDRSDELIQLAQEGGLV